MYTKIDRMVTQSMEKEKSCKNCQEQPFCELEGQINTQPCKNWMPNLEEFAKRWEIAELMLQGKSIEETAKIIKNKK